MTTSEPFNFEGRIYYPLIEDGCGRCHADKLCSVFKEALKQERPQNSKCAQDKEKEIIWRHGKKASIQYITERLMT